MGDFEIDAVLQFMLSKGGRVRNHELVTHFKNVLNHPVNKVQNREKFKDYVNELSTIKLDLGEKVLVLKKKYRPASENLEPFDFSSLPPPVSSSSSSAKTSVPKSAISAPSLTPKLESSVDPEPSEIAMDTKSEAVRAQSEPPSTPIDAKRDHLDGLAMSRMRSDEDMEVKLRYTDRVTSSAKPIEQSIRTSGSNASLASTESHKSSTSSTSGTSGTATEDDANASIISVRDKIKKLDNMSSVSDLQQVPAFKKTHKTPKQYIEDDDTSHSSGQSYVSLTPEQREWLVVSSSADYQEMNRLLSKNANLAKLRYTALHWAAKNGKENVIKLIANKPGVKVNQKSGYTPLHLAAIHNHEHIIELLVQTFKADPNIRDHSGKRPKQYLNAHSKLQQLLTTRRLGLEPNPNMDDSFTRSSERMSKRAKAVSTLLFFKSESAQQLLRSSWNGSSENLPEEHRHSSNESSPSSVRRKPLGSDMDLMPPPSNAMNSRRMRRTDRSKSSSRESLNSNKKGNKKNDENENITRAGSDTDMRVKIK